MKKLLSAFLCITLTVNIVNGQTVRRWTGGKIEMENKTISYQNKDNIFKDFKWTFPDVKSIALSFNNGISSFSIGGRQFTATLLPSGQMRISSSDGDDITSSEKTSDGDMYYDKANLKTKAVTQQVWTSHTTYTSQTVPVQKTRSVTSYSYQNGRSVPQYRTESYTAYEHRSVSKTEWRYEPRTTYVLDIPTYTYYSFKLKDGLNFVIYEAQGKTYYCQNSSYLIATDNSRINHIFIDVNSNGSFLDDEDKVMFNTWNPYAANSVFRSAGMFQENNWYRLKTLRESNFLSFAIDPNTKKLSIEYENSKYVDEDAKGKLVLSNLPDDGDTRLFINGGEYKMKKKEVKLKSQYGKFQLRIERKSHLDFERTYVIDEKNPMQQITYEPTVPAAYFSIQNVSAGSYFITVNSENNYSRTYSDRTSFTIPAGKSSITFTTNGNSFTKEVNLKAGEGLLLDYDDETKTTKPEEE